MVATFATFDARRATAAPARAQRVDVERVALAHPDEHGRFGAQPSARGHRQRLAPFGLEAGLGHERGQRAAERGVDHVGTRAEQSAGEHGHREQIGFDAIGGGGNDIEGGSHEGGSLRALTIPDRP